MKDTHLTTTRFSNLELSDTILRGLNDAGFNQCTPIQDKALPLLLRNKDVAGQAQTGTGKTATFLLATFQHLINLEENEDEYYSSLVLDELDVAKPLFSSTPQQLTNRSIPIKYPRALILAPTRELAIQIHKDALLLSKFINLNIALIYGGTDYQK